MAHPKIHMQAFKSRYSAKYVSEKPLIFALCVLFLSQPGQMAYASPTDLSGPGALRHVEQSCMPDYVKFCPHPLAKPDGRAMAFCLKYRKTDLVLGCRHAVEMAKPALIKAK